MIQVFDAELVAPADLLQAKSSGDLATVCPPFSSVEAVRARLEKSGADAGLVVWTSGSTGDQKPVLIPWDVVDRRCAVAAEAFKFDSASVVMGIGPASWSFISIATWLSALSVGAKVVISGNPDVHWKNITEHGVTHIVSCLAPLFAFERQEPVKVQYVIISGHQFPPEALRRVEACFRCPIIVSYGSSEAGTIKQTTSNDGVADTYAAKADDIPVRVVDGKVQIGGDTLAASYLDTPLPLDNGWFSQGDAGEIVDGALILSGRAE